MRVNQARGIGDRLRACAVADDSARVEQIVGVRVRKRQVECHALVADARLLGTHRAIHRT